MTEIVVVRGVMILTLTGQIVVGVVVQIISVEHKAVREVHTSVTELMLEVGIGQVLQKVQKLIVVMVMIMIVVENGIMIL